LANDSKETWDLIKLEDSTPTMIQLLVKNEEKLGSFLKKFKPKEGFKGFNFNLGCPDPEIISSGRGCAMIKQIPKINRLINIVRKYNYPISIKTRLGENNLEKKNKIYLNLLKETNPDFFIIHARSGEENYKDSADYSSFEECVNTGKEIIANGDIDSIEKVKELKKIGIRGVMIGRKLKGKVRKAVAEHEYGENFCSPGIPGLPREHNIALAMEFLWVKNNHFLNGYLKQNPSRRPEFQYLVETFPGEFPELERALKRTR